MHPLAELAKKAVEEYVMRGKVICPPAEMTQEMKERAGVFVCLKRRGELRGCIGTFEPCCGNVAEEIIRNAVAAATEDPRFHMVEKDELPEIAYSVDILSVPEKVKGPEDLDPRKYGVIVVSGGRRGLLLPDIEGVDSVEEQLRIAKRKACIGEGEDVAIFRFEVRRYS